MKYLGLELIHIFHVILFSTEQMLVLFILVSID